MDQKNDPEPIRKEDSGSGRLPGIIEAKLKSLGLDSREQEAIKDLFMQYISYSSSYQGPVAHPEIAKGWEDVVPGSAERLLTLAEKQSEHRIRLEDFVIAKQQEQSARGQTYGLIIGLACLLTCGVLALTGHDEVAGIVGGLDIVGLVTVFVLGQKRQQDSLKRKQLPR